MNGVVGGRGDHGAVVGAVFELWDKDLAFAVEGLVELGSEKLVGGNAAGENDRFGFWMELAGFGEFFDDNINGGFLEAGCEVGDLLLG